MTRTPTCDVLHIVWSGGIGGTERHVASLVRGASRWSSYSQHACFLDGRGQTASALVDEGLATALTIRDGVDGVGFAKFARVVRDMHPALIHFHTRNLAAHAVARLVLPSASIVYTEHAPGALTRTRRFRLFYACFRRRTDAFVAIAPAMADCMSAYGVPRARIVDVPHAVLVQSRNALDPPSSGWRLGTVARLESQKRVDLFLRVVAALRDRGFEATGLVVGDGSQRVQLERLALELGVSGAVEFSGSQADVVPFLDRMDALLMTSAVETLGLTALEAMARGVPVIAMPCPGGLSEIVRQAGKLADSRTVEEAARAVEDVLGAPDMREKLRGAGLALVKERTIPATFARMDDVYRTALSAHSLAARGSL